MGEYSSVDPHASSFLSKAVVTRYTEGFRVDFSFNYFC